MRRRVNIGVIMVFLKAVAIIEKVKIKGNKIVGAIVLIAVAICCVFGLFYSQGLLHSFQNNGEDYMKGYGHILTEDFAKGLRFLIVRHLLVSLLVCTPLLLVTTFVPKVQELLNTAVVLLFLAVVMYLGSKVYAINVHHWDGVNRTVEIAVMWSCRFVGYVVSLLTIHLLLNR